MSLAVSVYLLSSPKKLLKLFFKIGDVLPISGGALAVPLVPLSRGVLITPPAPRSPVVDVVRRPIARVGHLRHRSVWVVLLTVHQCWVEHSIVHPCIVLLHCCRCVLLVDEARVAGVYRHVWGAGLGGCAGGGYPPYLGNLLGGVVAHWGVAGREGEMGCGRGGGHSTVFTGL